VFYLRCTATIKAIKNPRNLMEICGVTMQYA
jgi:hypothetical protein